MDGDDRHPSNPWHEQIARWATSDTTFEYGHLKTGEGFGTSWRLEYGICPLIQRISPETVVLFIGSKFEQEIVQFEQLHGQSAEQRFGRNATLSFTTYQEVPTILSRNRLGPGAGAPCWNEAQSRSYFNTGHVFIKRATVVVAVDSTDSAEYALAITLLSRWRQMSLIERGHAFES